MTIIRFNFMLNSCLAEGQVFQPPCLSRNKTLQYLSGCASQTGIQGDIIINNNSVIYKF
jgi:hypothetical protein